MLLWAQRGRRQVTAARRCTAAACTAEQRYGAGCQLDAQQILQAVGGLGVGVMCSAREGGSPREGAPVALMVVVVGFSSTRWRPEAGAS